MRIIEIYICLEVSDISAVIGTVSEFKTLTYGGEGNHSNSTYICIFRFYCQTGNKTYSLL